MSTGYKLGCFQELLVIEVGEGAGQWLEGKRRMRILLLHIYYFCFTYYNDIYLFSKYTYIKIK